MAAFRARTWQIRAKSEGWTEATTCTKTVVKSSISHTSLFERRSAVVTDSWGAWGPGSQAFLHQCVLVRVCVNRRRTAYQLCRIVFNCKVNARVDLSSGMTDLAFSFCRITGFLSIKARNKRLWRRVANFGLNGLVTVTFVSVRAWSLQQWIQVEHLCSFLTPWWSKAAPGSLT